MPPPDRVAAYLAATVLGAKRRALTLQADLLAQQITDQIRSDFHAAPGVLPHGDPALSWRELPAGALVIYRRDGHSTLRPRVVPSDTTTEALLTQAFDSVRRHGGGLMIWPHDLRADSVVVDLSLLIPAPLPDSNGVVGTDWRFQADTAFLAFSLPVPHFDWTRSEHTPRIRYPQDALESAMGGHVLVRFVVEATGRVDPASVEGVWISPMPAPRGRRGEIYRELISATRDAVVRARFTPARLGGCPIAQSVMMPVSFIPPS